MAMHEIKNVHIYYWVVAVRCDAIHEPENCFITSFSICRRCRQSFSCSTLNQIVLFELEYKHIQKLQRARYNKIFSLVRIARSKKRWMNKKKTRLKKGEKKTPITITENTSAHIYTHRSTVSRASDCKCIMKPANQITFAMYLKLKWIKKKELRNI